MIQLHRVTKRYRSLRTLRPALDRMTFRVRRGEFVAVAGPNGAGKSTLLAILLGFLRQDDGVVTVGGLVPRDWVRRNGVGYLPEVPTIPRRWRTRDALRRLGLLDGLRGSDLARRTDEALARVGLGASSTARVGTLSRGSLQRLAIAQLLLRPRALLLLDEPFGGLDPFWRVGLGDLLGQMRREQPGVTILMASHDLSEIRRLADRLIVVVGGRVQSEVDLPTTAATDLGAAVLTAAVSTSGRPSP